MEPMRRHDYNDEIATLARHVIAAAHLIKSPYMLAQYLHDVCGWRQRSKIDRMVTHELMASWLRAHCDLSDRAAHMAADDFFDHFEARMR
jgi:hypothetical protein